MKLKSMKVSKAEAEESSKPSPEVDRPRYPYGLQVRLDNDSLEKLGIALPEVGKNLMLLARVSVTSVSSNKNLVGGNYSSAELQITDMCLETDEGEGKDAADKLYKG